MSSGLQERGAAAVHAALTALVRTNAAANPAWADYETLLLDPAAVSFFEAMLLKKRARDAAASGADVSDEDDDGVVCEHCGGPVPQISLRVASLGGTTLAVAVAQRGLVRDAIFVVDVSPQLLNP